MSFWVSLWWIGFNPWRRNFNFVKILKIIKNYDDTIFNLILECVLKRKIGFKKTNKNSDVRISRLFKLCYAQNLFNTVCLSFKLIFHILIISCVFHWKAKSIIDCWILTTIILVLADTFIYIFFQNNFQRPTIIWKRSFLQIKCNQIF